MWVTPIFILILFLGGLIVHKEMNTIDSVPEQIIEKTLEAEGVVVDFSAHDKAIIEENAQHE